MGSHGRTIGRLTQGFLFEDKKDRVYELNIFGDIVKLYRLKRGTWGKMLLTYVVQSLQLLRPTTSSADAIVNALVPYCWY